MSRLFEKGVGFSAGGSDLKRALNIETISSAVVATIFSITGPALMYINAAMSLGFTDRQAASWLFGCYAVSGVCSIILALYYKMPIVSAACIPGATMLASAMQGASYEEAVGTFLVSGLIILIIGLTGSTAKLMKKIPIPIVMGMVAGCMMNYCVNIITSAAARPLICCAAVLGYFLVPRISTKIPPMVGALVLSAAALAASGSILPPSGGGAYQAPLFTMPKFNPSYFLSVSLPLAILVVGAQNAQAIGVLRSEDYDAPVNTMTIVSGLASMTAAFFGGHNSNIAGPMTAICASGESGKDKSLRYGAAIVNGILSIAFGCTASLVVAVTRRIPTELISTLAGLALISVMLNTLKGAFCTEKFKSGAFFAMIIGLSGITVLGIGAAFWAMLFGVLVSLVMERGDFKKE